MQLSKNAIRFLALILTVAIIIATVSVQSVFVGGATSYNYWDGSTVTAPTDLGNGNFAISNAEQLAYVIKNGGGEGNTYTLTNDIYLNDLDKVDWTNGTVAEDYTVNKWYQGNVVPPFTGTLDGNGHIVYGIYYNSTTGLYMYGAGLIPEMGKATIKNIGIMTSYIGFADTYCSAAALVGKTAQTAEGVISCCFVGIDVTVNGYDVGSIAGGADPAGEVIIENCYSLATLIGSNSSGAFTSNSWGLLDDGTPEFKIINSYCLGKGNGSTWQAPRFTNTYATVAGGGTTVLTEADLKGQFAINKLANFDFVNVWTTTNSYPELQIFQRENSVWNGAQVKPTDLGGGKYEISDAKQLAYVIRNGGGEGNTYTLTKDIYLNDLEKVNWTDGTLQDGYTVNDWYWGKDISAFTGTLDGNGHIVYGLYYNNTTEIYNCGAGLIPKMGKATIKNIGVESSYIGFTDTYYSAAALVGKTAQTAEGTITCCFVGSNVTVKGYDVGAIAGGGGPLGEVLIENCYSLATLIGTRKIGAFTSNSFGILDDNTPKFKINNSYCLGKVTDSTWQVPKFTNTYATVAGGGATLVTEEDLKGETAAETLKNFDFTNIWVTTNSYPELKVFRKYDFWNGTTAEPTDLGDGNYEISTPEQLAYVIKNGGGEGNTYSLTNNIYLNDLSKINWSTGEAVSGYTPNTWYRGVDVLASFTGTLDGKGYSVYGLYYNSDAFPYNYGAGLIAQMGNATIKNIGIETSYINFPDEYYSVGALVGRTTGVASGMISQCYVADDVTVKGYNVSAIIPGGDPAGNIVISNCYSLAKLSGTNTVGALVGNSWTSSEFTIENSYCVNMATSGDWRPPVMTNVYETVKSPKGTTTLVTEESIRGISAPDTLKNLDFDNIWYAVNGENKSPMLRVRGLAIRDVNGNGKGFEEDDFVALRNSIFGTEKNINTDFNYDDTTDICDLVVFDSDKTLSASGDKYYSIADLKAANLPDGSIVDVSIKPYSVGTYKIVEDTAYTANGYSVLAIDSGKFAVRYYGENAVNNWNSEELSGGFVAHKSFNGYVDRWIVGEGGTTGTYPENTLEGVEHAVRLGYKVVEIDITVTKDNVWVLSHDAHTGSLYTSAESSKTQNMRDVTYDSIKNMPILRQTYYTGGWPTWEFTDDIKKEYVPTLASVFESQKDSNLYFILDNKYLNDYTFTDEQMDALAAVIKEYGMEERCAAYAACQVPLSKRIPNIGVAYSSMPSSDEETAANIIKSHKNYLMSLSDTAYSTYLDFCKKYDIPLAVWMTDDYIHAEELFAEGVDYVLTNSIITADDLTQCGYKVMDSMDTEEIISSLSFNGEGTNSVTTNAVTLNSDSEYSAQFSLSYSGMGLKSGDVLALTVDSNAASSIKIETVNGVRWYEKNCDGTTTLYYLVNDNYTYDLVASLTVNGGSVDFSNITLTHYRETVRSGLS